MNRRLVIGLRKLFHASPRESAEHLIDARLDPSALIKWEIIKERSVLIKNVFERLIMKLVRFAMDPELVLTVHMGWLIDRHPLRSSADSEHDIERLIHVHPGLVRID